MLFDLPEFLTSTEEFKEELDRQLDKNHLSNVVKISLNEEGALLSLDQIECVNRGRGYADKALVVLLSLCDCYKKDIKLVAKALDENTNTTRLIKWYERNGFVRTNNNETQMLRRCR